MCYYVSTHNIPVAKEVFLDCYYLVSKLLLKHIYTSALNHSCPYSLLDLLNLLFGVYMVYSFILLLVGYPGSEPRVLWCIFALLSS